MTAETGAGDGRHDSDWFKRKERCRAWRNAVTKERRRREELGDEEGKGGRSDGGEMAARLKTRRRCRERRRADFEMCFLSASIQNCSLKRGAKAVS